MEGAQVPPRIRASFGDRVTVVDFPAVFPLSTVRALAEQVAQLITPPHVGILTARLRGALPRGLFVRFGYHGHSSFYINPPIADRLDGTVADFRLRVNSYFTLTP